MSFAITASLTSNALLLLGISGLSMLMVKLFRDEASWSRSIRFYLQLGLIVVFIRVLFRIIFNLEISPKDIFLNLPGIEISLGFGSALQLFGPISKVSLWAAVIDGLRLATIILAVGMANSLANPRKLLKSTPGALYEVATAISISINLAPQLIASLNRVRRANRLRGSSSGLSSLPKIVIPVLEDSIDQSLALAASMSARGFGRRDAISRNRMLATRFSGLASLTALTSGIFLLLISPSAQQIDLALVAVGLALAVLYIKMSSVGSARTTYRPVAWRTGDLILLCSAFTLLVVAFMGVLAK